MSNPNLSALNFHITERALDRYLQYFCDLRAPRAEGGRREAARAQMWHDLTSARKLPEKTPMGDDLWQVIDPRYLLVVKQDHRQKSLVVVTIRPRYDRIPRATEIAAVRETIAQLAMRTDRLEAEARSVAEQIARREEAKKRIPDLSSAANAAEKMAQSARLAAQEADRRCEAARLAAREASSRLEEARRIALDDPTNIHPPTPTPETSSPRNASPSIPSPTAPDPRAESPHHVEYPSRAEATSIHDETTRDLTTQPIPPPPSPLESRLAELRLQVEQSRAETTMLRKHAHATQEMRRQAESILSTDRHAFARDIRAILGADLAESDTQIIDRIREMCARDSGQSADAKFRSAVCATLGIPSTASEADVIGLILRRRKAMGEMERTARESAATLRSRVCAILSISEKKHDADVLVEIRRLRDQAHASRPTSPRNRK